MKKYSFHTSNEAIMKRDIFSLQKDINQSKVILIEHNPFKEKREVICLTVCT